MKNYFLWPDQHKTDQQPYVEVWPGQRDRNNSHDQELYVDFVLIPTTVFSSSGLELAPSLNQDSKLDDWHNNPDDHWHSQWH